MRNEDGREIIYPSNLEVYNYLNDGYGICNKCGAVMDEEFRGRIDMYICPACGWEIDVMDYEYEEDDDGMELVLDENGEEFLIPKMDMPPAGCRACGGPYPYCKSTCREYDD